MSKLDIRDVSPMLKILRNFLLGRKHTMNNRFADQVATRSPEPPALPDGPCHGLAANYYYARDVRREVAPPIILSGQRQLIAGEKAEPVKLCTPGKPYQWD